MTELEQAQVVALAAVAELFRELALLARELRMQAAKEAS